MGNLIKLWRHLQFPLAPSRCNRVETNRPNLPLDSVGVAFCYIAMDFWRLLQEKLVFSHPILSYQCCGKGI